MCASKEKPHKGLVGSEFLNDNIILAVSRAGNHPRWVDGSEADSSTTSKLGGDDNEDTDGHPDLSMLLPLGGLSLQQAARAIKDGGFPKVSKKSQPNRTLTTLIFLYILPFLSPLYLCLYLCFL